MTKTFEQLLARQVADQVEAQLRPMCEQLAAAAKDICKGAIVEPSELLALTATDYRFSCGDPGDCARDVRQRLMQEGLERAHAKLLGLVDGVKPSA